MNVDPFDRDHAPPVGAVERIAPGLRVITAPNASPMTFTGTRSYIVGTGAVAIIDPGPDHAGHVAALVGALAPGERIEVILVTHAHLDHSPGARLLAARTGAPVLAHGATAAARSPLMQRLAADGKLGGGEGVEAEFRPDRRIGEGETVSGPGWHLTALHLPGHTGDHLCFAWAEGRAIFSGDLVMGWASTVISPPHGDLEAYLASLRRLQGREEDTYYPGHGKPVRDPGPLLAHLITHRMAREAQIVAVLREGPATIGHLTAEVYANVDPALHPAAARNVLAHLVALAERGRVVIGGPPGPAATYALA